MKVWVTKDLIDGTQSKARLVNLDGLDLFGMKMMLCEPGVVGFTMTRADILDRLEGDT